MKKRYFINGWEEGKRYFFSFGFTMNQIERMENGETIKRDNNEFRIDIIEE